MLPIIVIAGRPNVGKSTLFNRILRKRRAVTHSVAGVTRDPIEEVVKIENISCRLIDTGGFSLQGDELQNLVTEKVLGYLETATIIVLVVDINGLTPEDEVFIEKLRPYTDKIIVAANKADTPDIEFRAFEFFETGFRNIYPISAAHNRNIGVLEEQIFERIQDAGPQSAADSTDSEAVRITILGKPNTGKSTLLNTILAEDRAIVSDIPGTTRDVITGAFRFKDYTIKVMDTAGIRRKKKVSEDLEYYSVTRALDSLAQADVALLIVDAESGLTEQDKKIAAHAEKRGRGIILVINKWDLMEAVPNAENAFEDRIRFVFPILAFAPIVFISALKQKNISALNNCILQVWKQLNRTIQTATLNKHLQQWKDKNPLPRKKDFQWKIKYITQKGTNPVTFVMFVNRKNGFPAFYTRYIINNLRSEFGLSKIPIRLELQE